MAEARRIFGPVVLAGLASGVLAAVAGNRPWASGEIPEGTSAAAVAAATEGAGEMPLAAALGLVVLACWGVLLVTRGRVRRLVAVLGAVAALGLLVTTALGFSDVQDSVADALIKAAGGDTAAVSLTGWYAVAAVAAVGCVLTTAAAARLVGSWPEMGSRYDAPTGAAEPHVVNGPEGNLDLWKALDEGRDPTERPGP